MQKLKQLDKTTLRLTEISNSRVFVTKYKGYEIGSLPPKFAFTYNEDNDQEGITEWFNFKGLTYIKI